MSSINSNNLNITKIKAKEKAEILNITNKKMRVAAYARVSTDHDDQQSSFDNQKKHFERKIANNENWELVNIYADEGISGTKVRIRPAFKKMIDDAYNGKIDLIITKSISRFARNTYDTLNFVRLLSEKNVYIIFEEENINTMSMGSELLLTVLSAVAQQEAINISEHVKKGLQLKMQRGESVGTLKCFGYDYVPQDKQIYINKEQARIVKKMFDLYLEGNGTVKIARMLNDLGYRTANGKPWREEGITKILRNEKYTGDLLLGKSYVIDPLTGKKATNHGEKDMFLIKNHHEAIVSRKVFEKVKREMQKRALERKSTIEFTNIKYPFSGIVKCGFCGNGAKRDTNFEYPKYCCHIDLLQPLYKCENSKAFSESMIKIAFTHGINRLKNKIKSESRFSDKENVNISYARNLLLNKDTTSEKFDAELCTQLIKYVIIGNIDEKGKVQPYTLNFVIKTEFSLFKNITIRKIDISQLKTKTLVDFYCNQMWHDFDKKGKINYHNRFRVIISYEIDGEE